MNLRKVYSFYRFHYQDFFKLCDRKWVELLYTIAEIDV